MAYSPVVCSKVIGFDPCKELSNDTVPNLVSSSYGRDSDSNDSEMDKNLAGIQRYGKAS